jgi:hypothetical protein
MYEDIRDVLRPSNREISEFGAVGGRTLKRASSTPSLRESLRKIFKA